MEQRIFLNANSHTQNGKKNRIAINIGASDNTATNFIKQKYKRYKEMSLETLKDFKHTSSITQ